MGKLKLQSTDWTAYYGQKKSWFSTFTQTYTERIILENINKYSYDAMTSGIEIAELGGGNSCFAEDICKSLPVKTYDIFDNNELAVKLFKEKILNATSYNGNLINLLDDNLHVGKKYDFVYSIGLIEHFRGEDIKKIIHHHFDYCKENGIVLISFPTPTRKYRIVRKCMELFGQWRFYDEVPLTYDEVSEYFAEKGDILSSFINKKLPLTQRVIIARKMGE